MLGAARKDGAMPRLSSRGRSRWASGLSCTTGSDGKSYRGLNRHAPRRGGSFLIGGERSVRAGLLFQEGWDSQVRLRHSGRLVWLRHVRVQPADRAVNASVDSAFHCGRRCGCHRSSSGPRMTRQRPPHCVSGRYRHILDKWTQEQCF